MQGWRGFVISKKLKMLKLALKNWKAQVFGDMDSKIKAFSDQIGDLDLVNEEVGLRE